MNYILRVEIPPERVVNEVGWLEIEAGDGGYYLYQYERIEAPPQWDCFYQTLVEAKQDCLEGWGIAEKDWKQVARD